MDRLRPAALFLLVFALAPLLVAQEAAGPDLARADAGAYLVDAEGRALYLYLHDDPGASACYEQCAENWPPATVDGEPTVGERLIEAHVGTMQREDGSTQLTYAGWPLYRYAWDDEPGDIFGHQLGGEFYLVSPSGTRVETHDPEEEAQEQAREEGTEGEDMETDDEAPDTEAEDEAPDTEAEDDDDAEGAEDADEGDGAEDGEEGDGAEGADGDADGDARMEQGEQIYAANCAVCHGSEGRGGVGPGFVDNSLLGQTGTVVSTILFGRPDHGMPAFGDQLSDEEIAAVATYIRNAWGNDFGPVDPDEVAERR